MAKMKGLQVDVETSPMGKFYVEGEEEGVQDGEVYKTIVVRDVPIEAYDNLANVILAQTAFIIFLTVNKNDKSLGDIRITPISASSELSAEETEMFSALLDAIAREVRAVWGETEIVEVPEVPKVPELPPKPRQAPLDHQKQLGNSLLEVHFPVVPKPIFQSGPIVRPKRKPGTSNDEFAVLQKECLAEIRRQEEKGKKTPEWKRWKRETQQKNTEWSNFMTALRNFLRPKVFCHFYGNIRSQVHLRVYREMEEKTVKLLEEFVARYNREVDGIYKFVLIPKGKSAVFGTELKGFVLGMEKREKEEGES